MTVVRLAARLLALAFLLGSVGNAASAQTSPIIMKLGTATLHDAQEHWLDEFKALVEKDTHGRINVQVYPAGQLGSIPREIEDTQFGAIQGWVGPPEFLIGVDPRYQVFGTPGLFSGFPQMIRAVNDPRVRDAFLALGANKGLKGLSLWIDGVSGLFTRHPVHTLAEMNGLKVRVLAGATQEAQMRLFGATAVPMPLDQVLPALQQGAIDGTLTNIEVAAPLKYNSVAPYVLELNQPYVAEIVAINRSWFEALPPDLQKIVTADAAQVSAKSFAWGRAYDDRQRTAWVAGGGKLLELSPADQAELNAKLADLGDTVYKDQPPVLELYHMIKSAVVSSH